MATRLATSGFDYGPDRKPLKLLGARTIHVSVFVAVEFPDQEIVNFLKQYGQLKSENLRRLCYTEKGFTNIERGIRVAEFTSLDKDLPLEIHWTADNVLSMRIDRTCREKLPEAEFTLQPHTRGGSRSPRPSHYNFTRI